MEANNVFVLDLVQAHCYLRVNEGTVIENLCPGRFNL